MCLTINIVGAGNLGKAIGRIIVKNKLATINAVYNRNISNSVKAIEFIGEGKACHDLHDLPHADIVLITTPDDAIAETCLTLLHNTNIKRHSIIIHCSGALNSDVLSPMKQRGCYTSSIHPMHSFANPEISVEQFLGTYCAVEGDVEATKVVSRLFESMGAVTYSIKKDKKSIYHTSGVFASNYLITLFHQAVSCLNEAGVEENTGVRAIMHLMKGTLFNLERTMSAKKALTGPIQRGDVETVINHLNALDNPLQKELYAQLGRATLELTQHSGIKLDALNNALISLGSVDNSS